MSDETNLDDIVENFQELAHENACFICDQDSPLYPMAEWAIFLELCVYSRHQKKKLINTSELHSPFILSVGVSLTTNLPTTFCPDESLRDQLEPWWPSWMEIDTKNTPMSHGDWDIFAKSFYFGFYLTFYDINLIGPAPTHSKRRPALHPYNYIAIENLQYRKPSRENPVSIRGGNQDAFYGQPHYEELLKQIEGWNFPPIRNKYRETPIFVRDDF